MRKFLTPGTSLVIAFLVVGFNSDTFDFGIKKFVGVWEYKAPDAPYGYQNGTINLTREKRVLKGTVTIGSYASELQEIQTVKNQLKCYVSVEGERVRLKLDFDKDFFEGVAMSSEGDIPMTGTRTSK